MKPDYLYNAEECPCPRGTAGKCPRALNCAACVAFHRTEGNPPRTECEKKAEKEGYIFEIRQSQEA